MFKKINSDPILKVSRQWYIFIHLFNNIVVRNIFLFCLLLSALFNKVAVAQQCGNCQQIPKLAKYDLDIQVPQPKLQGKQTIGWIEWTRLFDIKSKIYEALKQNSGNCIGYTQPNDARISSEPVTTKEGIEIPPLQEESDLLKVGAYYTNLPPAGDVSRFGDYITTGYVKPQGNAFVLHIEIQTACERKIVAQATIPFDSLQNSAMTEELGNKAAAQLSPLFEKLQKFELDERQKDKKLSLFKKGDPMKITTAKKTLKAGESTDFTIELKDCDGVALQGREIFFTETEFAGGKIFGTIGGVVLPAKVTTDANGKATAKFTLKSGAKEAIINAHSPGNDVKGCNSIFIGDAPVNIRKVYSGFIRYSFDDDGNCEETSTSESGVRTDNYVLNSRFKIEYNASFYIDEKGNFSFSGAEENASPAAVPNVMESGSMIYYKKEIRRSKVTNNPPNEQVITKDQSGPLKTGSVSFTLDNNLPMVSLDLKFQLKGTSSFKQTYLPSGSYAADEEFLHSTGLMGDKLQYKKDTEGGKIKHTFTWFQTGNDKCKQVVERMQLQVIEE